MIGGREVDEMINLQPPNQPASIPQKTLYLHSSFLAHFPTSVLELHHTIKSINIKFCFKFYVLHTQTKTFLKNNENINCIINIEQTAESSLHLVTGIQGP